MSKKQRFDIHQHITDQIVAAIERGAGEFRLPWHCAGGGIVRPVNVASRKRYRGVNVVALWAATWQMVRRPGLCDRGACRGTRSRDLCADLRITDEPRADHTQ